MFYVHFFLSFVAKKRDFLLYFHACIVQTKLILFTPKRTKEGVFYFTYKLVLEATSLYYLPPRNRLGQPAAA